MKMTVTPDGSASTPALVTPSGEDWVQATVASLPKQGKLILPHYLIVAQNSVHEVKGFRLNSSYNADGGALPIQVSPTSNADLPVVAAHATTRKYLVAWQDDQGGDLNIRSRDVATDGTLGSIVPLTTDGATQQRPAVAARGADFVVVWEDFRASAARPDLWYRRMDADGTTMTGAVDTAITATSDLGERNIAVGGAGSKFLIVYEEETLGGAVRVKGKHMLFTFFGEDEVILVVPVTISTTTSTQREPAVAYDGTSNYVVAWSDDRDCMEGDIYATRIRWTDGANLDASNFLVSSAGQDQVNQDVASDEAEKSLLVWTEQRGCDGKDVRGVFVDNAGVALTPASFLIAGGTGAQDHAKVCHAGGGYLVAYEDLSTVAAKIVRDDGSIFVLPSITTGSGTEQNPDVGCDHDGGPDAFIVWEDTRNGNFDIFGRRYDIDAETAVAGGFGIEVDVGDERDPSVDGSADGSGNFYVAWEDLPPDEFSFDTLLKGKRLLISSGANEAELGTFGGVPSPFKLNPHVVAGDNHFLIAWEDGRNGTHDIWIQSVEWGGQLIHPQGRVTNSSGVERDPFIVNTPVSDDHQILWWCISVSAVVTCHLFYQRFDDDSQSYRVMWREMTF
jgi:hypothetical protein